MNELEKIEKVLEHIQNVQRNCYKLGLILLKSGEINLGRKIIANGQIHDNSKFKGIEFEHLFYGSPILKDVIQHHSSTNLHHPEYWGSIHNMPEEYIVEMVCDCTARSQEFGTDVRKWFHEVAITKYNFTFLDEVGLKIDKYLNLLLPKSF